ncbi:hypothetical protein [uncultured Gammaproteobacteria bacterium]|nr:hypothetical protein [uncultured Gammaproteobacteria bacterium]CAC9625283.1 hypothetical protein [uncultured Gammaproteobacteria bacterium]CAC9953795.1 hypothetical protein [uncultured Gammaproteobacteria bacterium]
MRFLHHKDFVWITHTELVIRLNSFNDKLKSKLFFENSIGVDLF